MRMPRPIPCPTCGVEAWKLEAEIERLRADLKSEREAHEVCVQMRNDAETDNKRLRGAFERLRAALKGCQDLQALLSGV